MAEKAHRARRLCTKLNTYRYETSYRGTSYVGLCTKSYGRQRHELHQRECCIVNDQRKCVVEVDYSDLNIEGKPCMQYLQDRGEENVRDWKSDMELCISQFVEKWNKDNKGALKAIAEKDEGTPLRLVVKMKRLHLGITALAVVVGFGSGDAHLACEVDIYDGNKEITKLRIDDLSSGSQYTESQRLRDIFKKLAARSVKCLKKACKKQK